MLLFTVHTIKLLIKKFILTIDINSYILTKNKDELIQYMQEPKTVKLVSRGRLGLTLISTLMIFFDHSNVQFNKFC